MNNATGWIAIAILCGLGYFMGDWTAQRYLENQKAKQEQRR